MARARIYLGLALFGALGCASSSSPAPANADAGSDAACASTPCGATDASSNDAGEFQCGDVTCFTCGDQTCHEGNYCQVTNGGPAGAAPRYACQPIPAACASGPLCTCLTSQGAPACRCAPLGTHVVVTCDAA